MKCNDRCGEMENRMNECSNQWLENCHRQHVDEVTSSGEELERILFESVHCQHFDELQEPMDETEGEVKIISVEIERVRYQTINKAESMNNGRFEDRPSGVFATDSVGGDP